VLANAEQRNNNQHQADDYDKKRDALKADFRPGCPRENADDKNNDNTVPDCLWQPDVRVLSIAVVVVMFS
jgi:hypothetical protein